MTVYVADMEVSCHHGKIHLKLTPQAALVSLPWKDARNLAQVIIGMTETMNAKESEKEK
jgi:hypothetical protein